MRGKLLRRPRLACPARIIPAHAGQTCVLPCVFYYCSDHPRACGANVSCATRAIYDYGSSPRMRGKRRLGDVLSHCNRIIPAHAGQTSPVRRRLPCSPDHPRACGANDCASVSFAFAFGSSPRMRGKRTGPTFTYSYDRIIPAHAGQTRPSASWLRHPSDHPRACGANYIATGTVTRFTGSSPRMRGERTRPSDAPSPARIIPAHAGQTRWSRLFVSVCTDHPRACGANSASGTGPSYGTGSSPRMRGKPAACGRGPLAVRIIPAHAGQTHRMQRGFMAGPDHPRACGANVHTAYQLRFPAGSSPRMRGKRLHDRCHRQRGRIIPAHAGQTTTLDAHMANMPDHPRACGANVWSMFALMSNTGSSPRMRGKRTEFLASQQGFRIIPAHAGQTGQSWHGVGSAADHPRACGANDADTGEHLGNAGSSPRMRGKQSDFMRKLLSAGPSIIGFAQWLQSSYYCSCLQSSAKTPISRGTTPTSLFLGFQNSITLLLLT